MAASLWVGGILGFALVIWPRLRKQSEQSLFAVCAARLSRLAGMVFGVVLLTGAYNAWHQLGRVDDLWSSAYGRIIMLKLALVCGMIALGAANRYFSLPLLRQGKAHIRTLMRRWTLEAWLALTVLFCAALLEHGMPPKKHGGAANHALLSNSSARGTPGADDIRLIAVRRRT